MWLVPIGALLMLYGVGRTALDLTKVVANQLHTKKTLTIDVCVRQNPSVSALTIQAELPPLIPREILFGNPERAEPQISPDGGQIAWLAPDKNGVLNVWASAIDGRESAPDHERNASPDLLVCVGWRRETHPLSAGQCRGRNQSSLFRLT